MYNTDVSQAVTSGLREFLRERFWAMVAILLMIPCFGAIKLRKNLLADADFLGGKAEIERFFSVNLRCLILALVIFAVEAALFFLFCVRYKGSALRIVAFTLGTAVSIITVILFAYSVKNIRSDLKSTTHAEPAEYVLSTSGEEYFLGFYDGGEYAQIPIKEKLYEELSEGKQRKEDHHSEIYDMVKGAGYGDVAEYKDKISIEYYFNSAMIESAKLK